ncbi:MAG: hypothetical protein KQ78_01800 [Candidatus Izimaplasma bacterium HR2]|nr:MAG: hypothetical protein KQ78_01800 [Candidatus Izimaplasma bacterium HR2]
MRLRCIYDLETEGLTYGKIYNLRIETNTSYAVKNDNGDLGIYFKFRFKIVKEEN